MNNNQTSKQPASFRDATGPIDITLRNDMLFHLVMQRSNKALKGLVCALKGLDPDTVKEVLLTNPINYSEYANKEIILDVKVILENNEIIDIELQLYKDLYWEGRSLLYLCRSFDNLHVGEKYHLLKPTTLIVITDIDQFPDYPEFYSHYSFLNIKNFHPYSSMLGINVLYLNHTDLATDEDKANNLVYWAELFRVNTWEELKALSTHDSAFEEVATVMYNSNIQSEEKTILEAHQRFLDFQHAQYLNGVFDGKKESAETIEALTTENSALNAENSALTSENERLKKLLSQAGISAE